MRRMLAAFLLLLACVPLSAATGGVSREYQLKAVFLFQFAQFVQWPDTAFPDTKSPLVIGVLGQDPFGTLLDEIVQGEKSGERPLVVQRYRRTEEIDHCHVLFIGASEASRLNRILAELKGRSILTVADAEDFARRGGMVHFFTENNRIRLRINLDAVRSAGLVPSSKLLRPAEIVSGSEGTP